MNNKSTIHYGDTTIGTSGIKTKNVHSGGIKTGMFQGGKNFTSFVGFGMFFENMLKELAIPSTTLTPHVGIPNTNIFDMFTNLYTRYNALEKKITAFSKILASFEGDADDYKNVSYQTRDNVYQKLSKAYK